MSAAEELEVGTVVEVRSAHLYENGRLGTVIDVAPRADGCVRVMVAPGDRRVLHPRDLWVVKRCGS